jgi:8-amino-7-oxononanoate synthase
MTDALDWLPAQLAELHEQGLARRRRSVIRFPDGWCEIDGRRLRNFASNDYLNLAHDPRLIEAARAALSTTGVGSGASALVTGRTHWHARLEERLARFERQPAAILFPTGYAANAGTIAALAGESDAVFSDRLNHASLIDGCRLSGAKLRVYRHNELERLDRELQKACDARRRLIVTDAVFSMDGHAAPLPALCDLADRHQAMLLVDEAHATGVLGEHGRGAAELLGIEDRVTVRVGTLSKALGALGGFVAGPLELIDWLWNRARTQMFSTALPPAVCAAACAALEIVESEPDRRRNLLARCDRFRRQLADAGLQTPAGGIGPIVPVLLQDPRRTVAAAARLEEQGFLVAAIRPPTVPRGTSRLRITLTAAHSDDDLAALLQALVEACTP